MSAHRVLALLVCCTMLAGEAWCGDTATAAAILKLPISVRQVGMGDLSLGPDDVLRAWSNPALLANQQARGAVAIGGASMFDGEDTTLGSAIGWRATPGISIGVLISSYGADFPEINEYGDLTGTSLERGAIAGGLVGAMRPVEWLYVGLTGKIVTDRIVGESETVFALDAGAAYFKDGVSGGVAVRNVGQEMYSDTGISSVASKLPLEWRAAGAYCYRPRKVTLGIEYVNLDGADEKIGIGVEWWAVDILALRAGMADVQNAPKFISFGLTVMYRSAGLDYAYLSHPLGDTHRASVSYAFGRRIDWE